MKIGDPVIVSYIASPRYVDGHRIWEKRKPINQVGFYVGYTYKQEGVYNSGNTYSAYDPEEYQQPFLSNIKSIRLLRIKFSERSNDSFAYPEDVRQLTKGE